MPPEKPSLRDRQKKRRREDMLVAARELFVQRGYSKTTMDAIAERADVGVATVHIYFSTKAGLFAELAKMDMSELKREGEALLRKLPASPVAAVHALLDVYIKVQNYISFDVVRDFVSASRKPGPLREVAAWINQWQAELLTNALTQAQSNGKVSPSLPASEMSLIIVDLMNSYFDRVMSGGDKEAEYKTLKKRTKLLFADWCS